MSDELIRQALAEELIRCWRSVERLRSGLRAIASANETLADVLEIDPDLQPEIGNAAAHLGEAILSLERAAEVVQTRLSVARERLDGDGSIGI